MLIDKIQAPSALTQIGAVIGLALVHVKRSWLEGGPDAKDGKSRARVVSERKRVQAFDPAWMVREVNFFWRQPTFDIVCEEGGLAAR